jgi:ATP-dependent 26S proteasome regulatory subunit
MKTQISDTSNTENLHELMMALDSVRQTLKQQISYVQDQTANTQGQSANFTPSHASALGQLCIIFGLSSFERDILVLCAGMELDANLPLLCAEAQSDPQRPYPTFSLALAMFATKHWSAITPSSPLRRWRLIEVGPGTVLTLSPLRIDERLLHYLMGEQCLDSRLAGLVKPLTLTDSPIRCQTIHQELTAQMIAIWQQSSHITPPIQLCHGDRFSKWEMVAAAAAQLNRKLYRLSLAALPTAPDDLNTLACLWEREALLEQAMLLLDCEEGTDPSREQAIVHLLESLHTPVVIISRDRLPWQQASLITFEVPPLSFDEQRSIWQHILRSNESMDAQVNSQIEQLVCQFNLSVSSIQSAYATALSQQRNHAMDPETALWNACRVQARPRLDDLAQRITSRANWNQLVLPQSQKQILRETIAHVRQRAQVYERWGFSTVGSRGLGISALFAGVSGTGKTMAAEVIAQELQLDLYRIDLSAVISKYIGETEKNLRRIFDAAETGGAILLFDEADALFGKRSDVKDSHDRHANVEVSYLLQRIEAYRGLAILTTNLKEAIDQAFMRRIRFVVRFPFPDAQQRREIWQQIFPPQMAHTLDLKEDSKKLARLNVSGGNIRSIALNAAFLAAENGEPLNMKHLLKATQNEYIKLERTLTAAEVEEWEAQ